MIEIYLKTNTNYDKNGDITLDPTSCTYKDSENLITLEHFIDDEGRWKYINFENVIAAEENGKKKLYRIYNVVKELYSVTAYARPIFFDLIDKVLLDVRPTSKTGEEALNILLEGTGYTGHSNITMLNTSYYIRKNIVEALIGDIDNSFLNRWGGEFYCENFDVYINDKIGSDNGVRVEFGYNLNEIEEDVNIEEVVTRIIPVGYNGIMLEGNTQWVDSPLINKYTQPKMRVIEFSDVKVKESSDDEEGFETIEEARAELIRQCNLLYENDIDKPTVNYKIDMINLSNTTAYKDFKMLVEVNKGDTVTCYIKHLDIDVKARVIDYERDLITGEYKSIELGNAVSNFFNEQADIQNKVNSILNSNGSVKAQTVEGTINAVKTQFKALKDIAQPQDVRAILFEDKVEDSPTFGCMCLGTMGFEIASSFKPGTKEWDFRTFGTGQGFFADYIVAGTMLADRIKSGMLMSMNEKTWINMDDGTFNFADVLKLIDGKLVLSHTNGHEGITLDRGGIKVTTYSETNGMEEVAKLIATSFSKYRDQNGLSICTTGYGDYIQIGYEKEDGNIRAAAYFVPVGVPASAGLPYADAGIYIYDSIFLKKGLNIKSLDVDHELINLSDNYLGIYGDNGIELGYKSGTTKKTRLKIYENSPAGTGDHIESFGNWNFKGWTLHNLNISNYTLSDTLANVKSRTASIHTNISSEPEDGVRYIYKDIETVDNKIILNIPNQFKGCNYTITSIVKKGFGDYAVIEEHEDRFIIETDRVMKMNIEISIDISSLRKEIKTEEAPLSEEVNYEYENS